MKKYSSVVVLSLVLVALAMPIVTGAPQSVPVPNGTRFVIRLNETISSKHNKVGDPFSATVISPMGYQGAIITGHLFSLKEKTCAGLKQRDKENYHEC
jgi:hypothetical protein